MDDDLFRKALPIFGEKVRDWWRFAQVDPTFGKDIEAWLRIELSKRAGLDFEQKEILLPPPSSNLAFGEYVLGDVVYGGQVSGRFGIREEEWLKHAVIFGIPGSGKSNILALMAKQLLAHNKPFIMFDWKRSLRDIKATSWGQNVTVFTVGGKLSPFYFNPLIHPPGIMPSVWIQMLTQVLETSFYCGFGVGHLVRKGLDRIYKEFGIYSAYEQGREIREWPIPMDVLEWIEGLELKGRKAGWRDSAERALDVLCFPQLQHVMNIRSQAPLEKALERPIILELDLLSDHEKVFFIDSFMLWLYHHALTWKKEREKLHAVLLVDEAHYILSKRQADMSGGESIVERNIRLLRELGIGVVMASQSPSVMSPIAIGNSYLTVALNLKHEADINSAAHAMLLNGEERKFLGQLEVGTGIVKLQGRHAKPFMVRFPLAGVQKGVMQDSVLAKIQKPESELSVIKPKELGLYAFSDTSAPGINKEVIERQKARKQKIASKLKRNMVRILNDVVSNPDSTYLERMKRLTLSGYTADKTKNELLLKGYMEEEEAVGPTGRMFKRFLVTEAGRQFLQQNSSVLEDPGGTRRHGGLVHKEVLRQLAERLRGEGWTVEVEKPIGNGREVDIHAERQGKKVCIQFETGESREHMLVNIRNGIEADYHEVYSVAASTTLAERITADLSLSGLDKNPRVVVRALSGFSLR